MAASPSNAPTPQTARAEQWFSTARDRLSSSPVQAFLYQLYGLQSDSSNAQQFATLFEYGKLAGGEEKLRAITQGDPVKDLARDSSPRGSLLRGALRSAAQLQNYSECIDTAEKAARLTLPHHTELFLKEGHARLQRANEQPSELFNRMARCASSVTFTEREDTVRILEFASVCANEAVSRTPSTHKEYSIRRDLHRHVDAELARVKGNYDGSFMGSLKDGASQREALELTRDVVGEDAQERRLAQARNEYEAAPTVTSKVTTYARLLRDRGGEEDFDIAFSVLDRAYDLSPQEHLLRHLRDDLKISKWSKKIAALAARCDKTSDDANLRLELEDERAGLLAFRRESFERRAVDYPNQGALHFELGSICLELHDPLAAVACFQRAEKDASMKERAMQQLGRAFTAAKWYDEAADLYREIVAKHPHSLDAQFGLAQALFHLYEANPSLTYLHDALAAIRRVTRENVNFVGAVELRQRILDAQRPPTALP